MSSSATIQYAQRVVCSVRCPYIQNTLGFTCIFMYMIQGDIKGEIMDLDFENYKNEKKVFFAHLNKLGQI